MRISDWSSDVCSSDLRLLELGQRRRNRRIALEHVAGVAAGDFLVATQVAGQPDLGVVGVAVFAFLAFGLENHVRIDATRLDRFSARRVTAGGGELDRVATDQRQHRLYRPPSELAASNASTAPVC